MKIVTWLVFSLAASTAAAAETPKPYSFEVGSPFPVLPLPSIADRSPLSIQDFRGRKVVLHLWASW